MLKAPTSAMTVFAFLAAVLPVSPSFADQRGVKIEGKAPADYIAAQYAKSWAVVVGIDEYEKVPRLTYAVADAKAMAGLLERQGFQVTSLYNKQADRRAILGELGDKLVKQVGTQDRVVIFYAGHGETQKAVGGKEMGYLLPVDGEQGALAETSISMGLIRDLADALPAKQVLFLVDVCYGGIAGQQFRSLPRMTEDYLKQITRERGRQLITAGGAQQEAMEGPEWGHSVFTYYLLEGLGKGLADLNDDGIIPASELHYYLDQRVFAAARIKNHNQRPEMWALAAERGEFVFFTQGKKPTGQPTTPVASGGDSADEVARLREDLEALKSQMSKLKTDEPKPVQEARARPFDAPRVPEPRDRGPIKKEPAAAMSELYNRSWALVVGASPDTRRVGAKLRDLGFHVVMLIDQEATPRHTEKALIRLSLKAEENDRVVCYFSGARAEKKGDSFVRTFKHFSSGLKARHLLVLIDSSFPRVLSPARASAAKAEKGGFPYLKSLTQSRSHMVIAATGLEQPLLEALSDKPDLPWSKEGYLTAMDLALYIQRRVPSLSPAQVPQVGYLAGEGDVVVNIFKPLEDSTGETR
jgi:hypothetical protein